MNRSAIRAVARLEIAEVMRSRALAFSIAAYLALAAIFLLVGMRESSILGFTGMGRVLMSFTHALLLVLPLVGLAATGQLLPSVRADGALELWFSQPLGRTSWFTAVSLVRLGALLVPLLVLMPALALYGRLAFGQPIPWAFLARSLAVAGVTLWCSVALGLLVSVHSRSRARALMGLLAVWALGVALLDFGLIGLMLQMRLPPALAFTLAGINPIEAARLALLSAADPELSVLGPVGFFLANRLGTHWLLVLGLGWPLVLGALAWCTALFRFQRGDLT